MLVIKRSCIQRYLLISHFLNKIQYYLLVSKRTFAILKINIYLVRYVYSRYIYIIHIKELYTFDYKLEQLRNGSLTT